MKASDTWALHVNMCNLLQAEASMKRTLGTMTYGDIRVYHVLLLIKKEYLRYPQNVHLLLRVQELSHGDKKIQKRCTRP